MLRRRGRTINCRTAMKNHILTFGSALITSVAFFSCKDHRIFNKVGWTSNSDPAFPSPEREKILDDLIANHKLVGLTYAQLTDSLGQPDIQEAFTIGYRITEDYGSDIDPVRSKNLIFTFSEDSVITSFQADE